MCIILIYWFYTGYGTPVCKFVVHAVGGNYDTLNDVVPLRSLLVEFALRVDSRDGLISGVYVSYSWLDNSLPRNPHRVYSRLEMNFGPSNPQA